MFDEPASGACRSNGAVSAVSAVSMVSAVSTVSSGAVIERARANVHRSRQLIAASQSLIEISAHRWAHQLLMLERNAAAQPPATALAGPSRTVHLRRRGTGLSLRTAIALSGLDPRSLWLEYVGLSGNRSSDQLAAFLGGRQEWPAHDARILAHVLTEHFWQQGIENPMSGNDL